MNAYESLKVGLLLLIFYEQGNGLVSHYPIAERKMPQVERLREEEVEEGFRVAPPAMTSASSAFAAPQCDCF